MPTGGLNDAFSSCPNRGTILLMPTLPPSNYLPPTDLKRLAEVEHELSQLLQERSGPAARLQEMQKISPKPADFADVRAKVNKLNGRINALEAERQAFLKKNPLLPENQLP
jgi:hypothetical protein